MSSLSDGRYSITVYIADSGDPTIDEKGRVGTSQFGHMWYSLDDNEQGLIQPYCFHPSKDGRPFTFIGKVKNDDNYTYMVTSQPVYRKAFPIRESEYKKLLNISEDAKNNNKFGPYEGFSNACIDFTWEILSYAGIGKSLLYDDGTLKVNSEREGHIWPSSNKYLVDAAWNFHMKYVVPNQSDEVVEDFLSRQQALVSTVSTSNSIIGMKSAIINAVNNNSTATVPAIDSSSTIPLSMYMVNTSNFSPKYTKLIEDCFSPANIDWTMFSGSGFDNIQPNDIEVWIGDKSYKGEVSIESL